MGDSIAGNFATFGKSLRPIESAVPALLVGNHLVVGYHLGLEGKTGLT